MTKEKLTQGDCCNECWRLIPEERDYAKCVRVSCPCHSPQEKPEWGMNGLLDQSAKRFDDRVLGLVPYNAQAFRTQQGINWDAVKAFLRSEQIAAYEKGRIDAVHFLINRVGDLGDALNTYNPKKWMPIFDAALQDTPNEPQ